MRPAPLRLLATGLALTFAAGCGIGRSVADECLGHERVYDRAQKRKTSLVVAGVPPDAAVHRAASERLARARTEYTACRVVASRSGAAG